MADGTFVHQLPLGPWDNFITFIGCRKTRRCAVVDPAWNTEAILREAERLDATIAHVLCTHSHFDHVDQVEPLLKHVDVPVHMLGEEIDFAGFRCENLARHAPGDRLTVGADVELTMVHTPGHTPGSTSYHLRDALVAGDTLFVNGCGRCDFVGGDARVMYATLRMLTDRLPGHTTLYPGHDYGPTPTSTLDEQLQTNPFLRLGTLEDFVAHRMKGKTPGASLPPRPEWSLDTA